MAQMYIDLYLSKNNVKVEEYNILSMSSLSIAMKLDEVDVMNLDDTKNPYSDEFTLAEYEKKVVSALQFKILPDTLYQWVEIFITYWDCFAANYKPMPIEHLFKYVWDVQEDKLVLR